MLRAYKTKLVVNNKERSYLMGCAGAARYVFNWGLAEWKRQYEAGGKPSKYALKKQFNGIKDELCPWIREYPYVITQEAFEDLGLAFQNFFRRVKQGEKPGYPKFKNRHTSRKSFRFIQGVAVESARIKLPVIGWLRLAEADYIPVDIPVKAATVSLDGDSWYVSALVEEPDIEDFALNNVVLGVDRGVKAIAAMSNGRIFENDRLLAKYAKKMARLQRELHRRKKGSANRAKTKAKINKLHAKIRHRRQHVLHNISRYATDKVRPQAIVLEDLNIKGMMARAKPKPGENGHYEPNGQAQKRGLNRAVSDAGMYELKRQIEYKAAWRGIAVLEADRWYPSSKTCSGCGTIMQDLTLSDRVYKCPDCGLVIDRDVNAAKNLAALAINGNL